MDKIENRFLRETTINGQNRKKKSSRVCLKFSWSGANLIFLTTSWFEVVKLRILFYQALTEASIRFEYITNGNEWYKYVAEPTFELERGNEQHLYSALCSVAFLINFCATFYHNCKRSANALWKKMEGKIHICLVFTPSSPSIIVFFIDVAVQEQVDNMIFRFFYLRLWFTFLIFQ